MTFFPEGTRTPLARAVSAEVRAVMAARRITGRTLASEAGFTSHNYLAIRLRDEKPLTLDDIEKICVYLEEETEAFIQRASDNHHERLWTEAMEAAKAEPGQVQVYAELDTDEPAKPPSPATAVEAASAVRRLDRGTQDTRKRAMQQLEDQAARDESGDRRR